MTRKSRRNRPPTIPKEVVQQHQQSGADLPETPNATSKHWIRDVIISLIVGVALLYLGAYFVEPGKQASNAYFYAVRVIDFENPSAGQAAVPPAMKDMLSIVVFAGKVLPIRRIYIHDVKGVAQVRLFSSDREANKSLIGWSSWSLDGDSRMVSLRGLPQMSPESRLTINLVGDVGDSPSPVIDVDDGSEIWPEEAFLVDGVWLFLGRYWYAVVVANVFLIAFFYYRFMSRAVRAVEQ